MIAEPSKTSRRLVGRLDSGEDIVAAITRLCELQQVQAGEVRVYGTIEGTDLVRMNGSETESIAVSGDTVRIAQCAGRVAVMGGQVVMALEALLCGDGPFGQQFVFGMIRKATAVDVEFFVDVLEDIEIQRELDENGNLSIARIVRFSDEEAPIRERKRPERIAEAKLAKDENAVQMKPNPQKAEPAPAPEPEPEEEPQTQMSWEEAAEAAEEVSKPADQREKRKTTKLSPRVNPDALGDDDDDAELMKPGDILDHPKLGKCRVIRVEGDEFAHIRLSRGQIRKLALEICEVTWVDEEDGRNIFKVRIRK